MYCDKGISKDLVHSHGDQERGGLSLYGHPQKSFITLSIKQQDPNILSKEECLWGFSSGLNTENQVCQQAGGKEMLWGWEVQQMCLINKILYGLALLLSSLWTLVKI